MDDVKCPYCGEEQEINHDDGYGYDEGDTHEQYCNVCDKEFEFTTSISFDYQVYCKGAHDLEQHKSPHDTLWSCKNCDHYEVIS